MICGTQNEAKHSSDDDTAERLVAALKSQEMWLPQSQTTPSRAVGVVYKGRIVLEQATENSSPSSTVFAVASISKLILSVLTLQCVEKNELKSLDEDINAYLPPSCHLSPPCFTSSSASSAHITNKRVITFRMLLTHSSGLDDDESALMKYRVFGKDFPSSLTSHVSERLKEGIPWSQKQPPEYHYSNLGMTILGAALEHITRESLATLAKCRIFIPLKMTRSSFLLSEALSFPDSSVAVPHEGGRPLGHSSVAEWPAAALRSTVHDLCLFLAHFTSDVAPTILLASSVKQMLPSDYKEGLAWWGCDTSYGVKSPGVWSHGGFMVGVRSHIYLWPEEQVGLVFMQNGSASYRQIINDLASFTSKTLGLAANLPTYEGAC